MYGPSGCGAVESKMPAEPASYYYILTPLERLGQTSLCNGIYCVRVVISS